jgi:hypothetical protein
LWDIGADRQIATVELEDLGLNGFLYTSIEFSPDGKFVDSVTDLGAIRLSVPALTMVSQVGVRRSQCNVAHLPAQQRVGQRGRPWQGEPVGHDRRGTEPDAGLA